MWDKDKEPYMSPKTLEMLLLWKQLIFHAGHHGLLSKCTRLESGAQTYIQTAKKSWVAQGLGVASETFQSSFLLQWFFKAFSSLLEDIQRRPGILPEEPSGSLTQRTSTEEFVVPMSQQSPRDWMLLLKLGGSWVVVCQQKTQVWMLWGCEMKS